MAARITKELYAKGLMRFVQEQNFTTPNIIDRRLGEARGGTLGPGALVWYRKRII